MRYRITKNCAQGAEVMELHESRGHWEWWHLTAAEDPIGWFHRHFNSNARFRRVRVVETDHVRFGAQGLSPKSIELETDRDGAYDVYQTGQQAGLYWRLL